MEELVKELLTVLEQLDDSGYYSYEEIEKMKEKADELRLKLSEMVFK